MSLVALGPPEPRPGSLISSRDHLPSASFSRYSRLVTLSSVDSSSVLRVVAVPASETRSPGVNSSAKSRLPPRKASRPMASIAPAG